MKRIAVMGLVLVVSCGVLAAPKAEAGWFNKKKKAERIEMPEWTKKARGFEDTAKMSFVSGELKQDGWTGWKIGETQVHLAKDCRVYLDGVEGASLTSGRPAVVMGSRVGNVIYAWNISISKPSFAINRNTSYEVQLEPSNTSSDCGEIISAPH